MIKNPQISKLSIQIQTNQEDYFDNINQDKRVTEDQNENNLKFLYAFEKPTINNKNVINCCKNNRRQSVFDFQCVSVSSTKTNQKKAFSIALSYFKNEERKPLIKKKQENLYGFSKVSLRIK